MLQIFECVKNYISCTKHDAIHVAGMNVAASLVNPAYYEIAVGSARLQCWYLGKAERALLCRPKLD